MIETQKHDPVLTVKGLGVAFGEPGARTPVVRDVSFTVHRGEMVGLVGESGSGKSVTGLSLMGLLDSDASEITGVAELGGVDLLSLTPTQRRRMRGSKLSMVFQEPMTALDPVFTVGAQIVETIRAHRDVSRKEARKEAVELLDSVGIADARNRFGAYPHQLSGGMRQRVMIAIAIACRPALLIADEPTTAVDVTIQAQLLELLKKLSREFDTAVLFITHDLGVVAETCDRMITMYAGEVVEQGDVESVLSRPVHPYTAGLLAALPRPELRGTTLDVIPGRVPGPGDNVGGCLFHPRCVFARDKCKQAHPALLPSGAGRDVRCVRAGEITLEGAGA